MTTSPKHRDFLAESIHREKPVLGKKHEERHFEKAYVVLGQFSMLKKDEELFWEWLKDRCGINAKQPRDCFGCLPEWCNAFL